MLDLNQYSRLQEFNGSIYNTQVARYFFLRVYIIHKLFSLLFFFLVKFTQFTQFSLAHRYSCQIGYSLDPPIWAVRKCGALGHWQGSQPICRREYVMVYQKFGYNIDHCSTYFLDNSARIFIF